jgi:hypothetical protein
MTSCIAGAVAFSGQRRLTGPQPKLSLTATRPSGGLEVGPKATLASAAFRPRTPFATDLRPTYGCYFPARVKNALAEVEVAP